eukprot:356388-Chlamydomonas_euryale.AAC.2
MKGPGVYRTLLCRALFNQMSSSLCRGDPCGDCVPAGTNLNCKTWIWLCQSVDSDLVGSRIQSSRQPAQLRHAQLDCNSVFPSSPCGPSVILLPSSSYARRPARCFDPLCLAALNTGIPFVGLLPVTLTLSCCNTGVPFVDPLSVILTLTFHTCGGCIAV